jgi:hypothetical protein
MAEPQQVRAARQHLARAEANYRSGDGLFHLKEGLALLEELLGCGEPAHRMIARNLAETYATKIFRAVSKLVETDRGLPEPELEHLFKVVLAFDEHGFELPAEARSAKVGVVEHLVNRYYEGHSPEEKRKVLEELAKISGGPQAGT